MPLPTTPVVNEFNQGNFGLGDIIDRGQGRINSFNANNSDSHNVNFLARSLFKTLGDNVGGFGADAAPLAFGNLIQNLLNQGRTDPAALNRQLGDISRTTQSRQDQQQGSLARSNLQGSGVGQAINAAIGMGGDQRRADLLAQDARLAEDRKRQDIDQFASTILGPAMGNFGAERGATLANQQRKTDALLAGLGGLGTLLGGLPVGEK